MSLIDLHTHTTASDGSLTPSELLKLAYEKGLKAVAVTDHDTLAGLPEAIEAGRELGVELVPGVEISAHFKPGTMHILGYDFDFKDPVLIDTLKKLQQGRRTRNPRIVEKLNSMGMDISMREIEDLAGDGQIGRPHFARLMVDKGYAHSVNDAFDRFLSKSRPAYVEKFKLTPVEAMDMIRQAGGAPVLAHPFTLNIDNGRLEEVLTDLKSAGLVGLEVYYSEHNDEMTGGYLKLARKLDLAPTGGSDYHGNNKDEISIGSGCGNLDLPYQLLVDLRKKRKEVG